MLRSNSRNALFCRIREGQSGLANALLPIATRSAPSAITFSAFSPVLPSHWRKSSAVALAGVRFQQGTVVNHRMPAATLHTRSGGYSPGQKLQGVRIPTRPLLRLLPIYDKNHLPSLGKYAHQRYYRGQLPQTDPVEQERSEK